MSRAFGQDIATLLRQSSPITKKDLVILDIEGVIDTLGTIQYMVEGDSGVYPLLGFLCHRLESLQEEIRINLVDKPAEIEPQEIRASEGQSEVRNNPVYGPEK